MTQPADPAELARMAERLSALRLEHRDLDAAIARLQLDIQADELLAALLAHPLVAVARVSTEKPDVYPDCASVGVEVFGFRQEEARP